MVDELKALLCVGSIGLTVGIIFVTLISIKKSDVESGKQFIIHNSTYKCQKTNELKIEE